MQRTYLGSQGVQAVVSPVLPSMSLEVQSSWWEWKAARTRIL